MLRPCRVILIPVLTVSIAGCATYTPSPIEPADIAAAQRALTVDTEEVRREITRIAPTAAWNGQDWNGLAWLAAALNYNSGIARARATAEAAAAEARAARVSPGPNFTLSDEYAFGPAGAPSWIAGIASDMLLDIGGRRKGRVTRADIEARIALYDLAAQIWSVRMRIRHALIQYAGAKREAEVARALVSARERQLTSMEHRLSAGAARLDEVTRIRADLAADRRRLATAAAGRSRAIVDLAAAVGVPEPAIDPATLPRIGEGQVLPESDLPDDAMRQSALLARNDVLHATAVYDEAESALRTAVAAQYPELRLGPSFQSDQGVSKLGISLGLAFPALDLNRAAIAAAESRRREAARRVEETVAAVRADIGRAEAEYRVARSNLMLMEEQALPAAQALAGRADAALAAGSIDRAEWAAAQTGLFSVRLDQATAMRQALEALAGLEDALRQPFVGPELAIAVKLSDLESRE